MTRKTLVVVVMAAVTTGSPALTRAAGRSQTPRTLDSISGTVVDVDGQPVAEAMVTVSTEGLRRWTTTTATGEFLIRDLPPGTYRVDAGQAFSVSDPQRITVGGPPVPPLRLTLGATRYGGEGSTDAQQRLQQAFDQAEARWRQQAPDEYSFTIDVGCFCAMGRRPMTFRVAEGQARATVELTDAEAWFYERYNTIPKLMLTVRQAIAMRPYRMTADFDARFGLPVSVSIDPNRAIFDEELRFTVADFELSLIEVQR